MRILIYALPRTGSTSLTRYISTTLHYKEIIEPYNENRFWDKDLTEFDIWERDNVVVKMILGEGNRSYEDIKSRFDKVIVLYRDNIKEQAESFAHARNSIDWHAPYRYDPSNVPGEEYNEIYTSFKQHTDIIKNLNEFIIRYEDLYISGIDKDRLDEYLGITSKSFRFLLDSKNKYRQTNIGRKSII
jgi:hypothetical protein